MRNLWKTWCRNPSSMEGIFTAQMLHMFMHESEKQRMPMACYFEPVNEGAMQVHPDHTELTATVRPLRCSPGMPAESCVR